MVLLDDRALNIYVDGSCLPNPRRGGIGIRFITFGELSEEVVRDFDELGYRSATNNQMELQACIVALRYARELSEFKKYRRKIVYTDSKYVVENFKRAVYDWQMNDWKNRDGRPILNAKIWMNLIDEWARNGNNVEFKKVKGHSKDLNNRAVDKLAKISANKAVLPPLTIVSVRRKRTSKALELGSVKMLGQTLLIRPITIEHLRAARVYRAKYEVIDRESEFFGQVDVVFSRQLVRDGHCYRVTLGEDMKNPTIENIEEIECPPFKKEA